MPRDEREAPAVILCQCEPCSGVPAVQSDGAVRCACGSLLARYFGRTIELKCRRCKRTVMVERDVATSDVSTSG